jgi:hypothetical protein
MRLSSDSALLCSDRKEAEEKFSREEGFSRAVAGSRLRKGSEGVGEGALGAWKDWRLEARKDISPLPVVVVGPLAGSGAGGVEEESEGSKVDCILLEAVSTGFRFSFEGEGEGKSPMLIGTDWPWNQSEMILPELDSGRVGWLLAPERNDHRSLSGEIGGGGVFSLERSYVTSSRIA